jgi:glycerol-3-phosphate acyltransferase PlsY
VSAHRPVAARVALAAGAAGGYLAGSVSFSRLVGSRTAPGQDLNVTLIEVAETGTTVEFHGITPTSVKEHAGNRAMMLSIVMEAAKAAVPTLVARTLMPGTPAAPAAAAGAVIGHIFPMWSGWRGGYGMSPMIGGLLVLDPAGLAVTTAGLSSVILASHDRRLMMLWPVTVPLWGAARGRRDILAFGVVANVAYWARLVPELRRGLRSVLSVARPVSSGGFHVAAAEGGGSANGKQDPEEDEPRG